MHAASARERFSGEVQHGHPPSAQPKGGLGASDHAISLDAGALIKVRSICEAAHQVAIFSGVSSAPSIAKNGWKSIIALMHMDAVYPEHSVGVVSYVLPATAADRYGEWLLGQPRTAVFTLSFKQSVPRNSKIATSELGSICDQKDRSALVGAILIPVDGTFENRQRIIPVLIWKKRGPI